jgi:hypothetical protein
MGADSRIVTIHNVDELSAWCGGRVVIQHDAQDDNTTWPAINVQTEEGVQRAQVGDMLMRNHDETFTIVKREKK